MIEVFNPYDYISAKHVAVLLKSGEEDYNSDAAKAWTGTLESYTFNEQNGKTDLTVDIVLILTGRKCLIMVFLKP